MGVGGGDETTDVVIEGVGGGVFDAAFFEKLGSKEKPVDGVSDGGDVFVPVVFRSATHVAMKLSIGEELEGEVGNGLRVAGGDEETSGFIDDLQGNAAAAAADNGDAFHQRFGNFDFEAFFAGKLEGNMGV